MLKVKSVPGVKVKLIGPFQEGGFFVDTSRLNGDSIVYSLGVGNNIEWDLAMIEQFGCKVFAYDPDPLSIEWLSNQTYPPEFIFSPVGIGDHDGEQIFYQPHRPGKIDKSTIVKTSLPSSLPVKKLQTLLRENNHSSIDLLKVNVEGSEFAILEDILAVPVQQLVIEFHGRFYRWTGWIRTLWARIRIWQKGFVHIATEGSIYTFVRTNGH